MTAGSKSKNKMARVLSAATVISTIGFAGVVTAAPASAAQWYTSAYYSTNAACVTAMNNQARHGARTDGCYFKQTAPYLVQSYFRYYK